MTNIARSRPFVLAQRTIQKFMDDQCMNLAASVAYFGFLSLFPLLLFLVAVLAQFLASPDIKDQILSQVGSYLPGAQSFVSDTIQGVLQARGTIGVLSALTLLWSGTGIFGAISQAVNDAWKVRNGRSFIQQNLLNLGLAIAAGFFLLISIALTGSFNLFAVIAAPLIRLFPVNVFWAFIGLVIPFLSTLAVFLIIFKVLPYTRVMWKEASTGAVVAAVLFEILKNIFGWYATNLANYNAVYGSLGTVAVLLTWTYFSSAVLLLGAELSSVVAEESRLPSAARQLGLIREPDRARDQRKQSPGLAVAVAVVTVGLIVVRSILSVRAAGELGRRAGLLGFLKKGS